MDEEEIKEKLEKGESSPTGHPVKKKKSRNDVLTKKQQNPSKRGTSLSVKVPYS